MLGGPLIDGGVVGSGVGKGLACQPTTLFECEAFSIADAAGNQRIVGRIGDDGDSGAVLGGGTNHRRPADIDLLDRIGLIGAGTHRIGERIQVHNHQIKRLDAELLQLGGMIRVGHIRENTRVDMRVECFDTTIQALGETGDLAYLGDGYA